MFKSFISNIVRNVIRTELAGLIEKVENIDDNVNGIESVVNNIENVVNNIESTVDDIEGQTNNCDIDDLDLSSLSRELETVVENLDVATDDSVDNLRDEFRDEMRELNDKLDKIATTLGWLSDRVAISRGEYVAPADADALGKTDAELAS